MKVKEQFEELFREIDALGAKLEEAQKKEPVRHAELVKVLRNIYTKNMTDTERESFNNEGSFGEILGHSDGCQCLFCQNRPVIMR